MPSPEKLKRNKQIYKKRENGYTWDDLSIIFKIRRPTLIHIWKREREKLKEQKE